MRIDQPPHGTIPAMKCFRRWTLNLLAGISLLLFLATIALWVHGHYRFDKAGIMWRSSRYHGYYTFDPPRSIWKHTEYLGYNRLQFVDTGRDFKIAFELPYTIDSRGVYANVEVYHASFPYIGNGSGIRNNFLEPSLVYDQPLLAGWMHGGFGYVSAADKEYGFNYHAWLAPMWCLSIIFALLPAARFRGAIIKATRGRRRQSRGLCVICGYDLRATPDRCPECGSAPGNRMNSH
jgi:hypothetical protein